MLRKEHVDKTNVLSPPRAAPLDHDFRGANPIVQSRRGFLRKVAQNEWGLAFILLALDIAAWVACYSAASYLRDEAFGETPGQLFGVGAIELVVVFAAIFIIGGYNRDDKRTLSYTTEHMLALIAAALVSAVLIYSAAAYGAAIKPSRAVFAVTFLAFTALSIAYRRLVHRFFAASIAHRAFLVVGSGEIAAEFYRAYRTSPNRQRLEFVDIERQRIGEHIAGPGTPIIEGDLATKLANLGDRYSGVILAERVDRLKPELLERLVRTQFHHARVYTLEGFYEAHWKHVPVSSIDPFWPLQMGFQLAQMSPYHYLKRLFDIVFSAVCLVLCSPLLALITLLVWWQNGRPALFRQERVGREGQLFTILKFRTMGVNCGMRNADSGTGTNALNDEARVYSAIRDPHSAFPDEDDIYTRANDPRVTKLGRWLRKLRLDELPQLWNVLRGDMSLIGPRAEWNRCAERYEKKIPFYHFRHLVKPGITGWAQVNYPYGESDEDALEKLKYDLYYIRRYSLKLDAMIVLKTVHTMLFARGR
ncbi:MAG: sugar transferase [Chthoniobacterales bacterium]